MENVRPETLNQVLIKALKVVFTRAVIFYCLVVVFSNCVVNYPRLAFIVKIKNLNVIMPESFAPMIQLAQNKRADEESFGRCFIFYKEVVDQFPRQADALGMMGFLSYHAGQPLEAIWHYQKAEKIRPDVFWFPYNMGLIFFKEGRYRNAIDALKKAVAANPAITLKFIASSGVVYRSILMADLDFSRQTHKRLTNAYRDAYQLMALSYFRLKDFQQMLAIASEAITAGVQDPYLFEYYAGLASYELKEYDRAMMFLKEASMLQPDVPEIPYYLALTYEARGDKQEARKSFEKATKLMASQKTFLPTADTISLQLF